MPQDIRYEHLDAFVMQNVSRLNVEILECRAALEKAEERIDELENEVADLRASVIGEGGIAARTAEVEKKVNPVVRAGVKWSGVLALIGVIGDNLPAIKAMVGKAFGH